MLIVAKKMNKAAAITRLVKIFQFEQAIEDSKTDTVRRRSDRTYKSKAKKKYKDRAVDSLGYIDVTDDGESEKEKEMQAAIIIISEDAENEVEENKENKEKDEEKNEEKKEKEKEKEKKAAKAKEAKEMEPRATESGDGSEKGSRPRFIRSQFDTPEKSR